jgi:hypothetical protein
MFNISKKISVIVILLTILSTVVYASYCEYKCVYCGMVIVSGCGSPPSSYGYCSRAPDKMHYHMLTRQTR